MSVSLLSGWFPVALRAAAAVAVLVAVARPGRRWWTRRAPVAAALAAGLAVAAGMVADAALRQPEPLPDEVWFWVGMALFALMAALLRGAAWQRGIAVVAALLAVAAAASTVNAFVGYYPTVGVAFDDLAGVPVPAQIDRAQLSSVDPNTRHGRVVAVDVPADYSHFAHRLEYVYLPPAWFRTGRKEHFPAVEMIGAEFAEPDNWIRVGGAVTAADAYAGRHHGWAPILVFTDPSGGFAVDTECVDGPHGNAETHLVRDIPAYVTRHFGARATGWGVVGWSMGGTCAVDLAVEHPAVFAHFLDISGDLGPNTGNRAATVDNLYGGSVAAWAAHDPLTVLAHHPRYPGTTGLFVDGSHEHRTTLAARLLSRACDHDGMRTGVVVRPGGHTWQFAARTFAAVLPAFAASLAGEPA
ncbi:alpha/beta hydrolase [Actinophytocola sp. KF-1]